MEESPFLHPFVMPVRSASFVRVREHLQKFYDSSEGNVMFESYSKEVKEELHSCEHHARNLLRSCASYGSSRSLLQLARAHRKEGNPLWILYIQKAAEVGELPEAYIELGTCYQHGLKTPSLISLSRE